MKKLIPCFLILSLVLLSACSVSDGSGAEEMLYSKSNVSSQEKSSAQTDALNPNGKPSESTELYGDETGANLHSGNSENVEDKSSEETDTESETILKDHENDRTPSEPNLSTDNQPKETGQAKHPKIPPSSELTEDPTPETKPVLPEDTDHSVTESPEPEEPVEPPTTELPPVSEPPKTGAPPEPTNPPKTEPPVTEEPPAPEEPEPPKEPTQADFDWIIAEVKAYAESYRDKGFTFVWKEEMEFSWEVGWFGTPRIRYEGIDGTIEMLKYHVDKIYRTGTDPKYGATSDSVTYKVVQITVDGDIAFAVIYGG